MIYLVLATFQSGEVIQQMGLEITPACMGALRIYMSNMSLAGGNKNSSALSLH